MAEGVFTPLLGSLKWEKSEEGVTHSLQLSVVKYGCVTHCVFSKFF